ncbi:MAG: hypothetical protein WBX01_05685 [Nitrososphaeraceae archaeon]
MNLKLQPTGDYSINVIDSKLSLIDAEKATLRDIIPRNRMELIYKKKRLKAKQRNKKCGLFLDVMILRS